MSDKKIEKKSYQKLKRCTIHLKYSVAVSIQSNTGQCATEPHRKSGNFLMLLHLQCKFIKMQVVSCRNLAPYFCYSICNNFPWQMPMLQKKFHCATNFCCYLLLDCTITAWHQLAIHLVKILTLLTARKACSLRPFNLFHDLESCFIIASCNCLAIFQKFSFRRSSNSFSLSLMRQIFSAQQKFYDHLRKASMLCCKKAIVSFHFLAQHFNHTFLFYQCFSFANCS